MVGDRLMKILAGDNVKVLFIKDNNYGEDLDRGIRGTAAKCTVELKPRPTLAPVNGTLITRQSAVLKLGDYQTELSGSQVTEKDLQDPSARIQVGCQEFRIVLYDTNYVDQKIAYFDVFIRGISS